MMIASGYFVHSVMFVCVGGGKYSITNLKASQIGSVFIKSECIFLPSR